ncbi:hypothetical protein TNCV_3650821 [Trichonephila clavipes]|uniref:G2/M phase-specific E3 ubiquitin-protein ligase n=1 Tax=Trichonephila clavipes TaxID=2585209 RepID=A0A8X6SAB6_TRICX|nr:hypothetical protein TNCV_3650821 [Trichonephila clavipes]
MPQKRKRFQLQSSTACVFCGKDENNEFLYGKFFHTKSLSAHQNCLFFASGLCQSGRNESVGILGFLISDIEKEVMRGKKLKCFHCKLSGATVGCCKGSCRRTFHYPCSVKSHSLNQFFDKFLSYCELHRPWQEAIETPEEEFYCRICYLPLSEKDTKNCLYTSCCNHNWYHHACLQKYALSAGRYFFKCPLCNNSSDFLKEVEFYGICIPEKDASWELEENAYQDLLYRPECSADNCYCANGRKYNGKSSWVLLTCFCCGSVARHRHCANLKNNEATWKCEDCKVLEDEIRKKKLNPQSTAESAECNKQDSQTEKTQILENSNPQSTAEKEECNRQDSQTEKTQILENSNPQSTAERAECNRQDSQTEKTQILKLLLAVSEPSCSYVSSNSAVASFKNNAEVTENAVLQQSIASSSEIKVTSAKIVIKKRESEKTSIQVLKRKIKQELNSDCKKPCLIDNILNQIKEKIPQTIQLLFCLSVLGKQII